MLRAAAPWVGLWALILLVRVPAVSAAAERKYGPYELERTARSLLYDGFLGNPYPGHARPSAHVAPAYPSFLAAVYRVAGAETRGRTTQAWLAILVVGVGISLLPAVGRAVVGSAAAGWAAAVLMAVLPFGITDVQVRAEWEQPWVFTGTALMTLGLAAVQRVGWAMKPAAGLGLLTGALALVSPVFVGVLVLFAAAEVVARTDRRRVVSGTAVAGAVAALVVAPWVARCYAQLGGFVPVRSNFGLELAVGNHDAATGWTYGTGWWDGPTGDNPFFRLHPFTNPADAAEARRDGELAYVKRRQREAADWIAAHPGRYAELTLTRVALFWFPRPGMWDPNEYPDAVRATTAGAYWLTSALMLAGLVRLAVRNRPGFRVAAAVLLGLSATYYLTHVDRRYALPTHGLALVVGADFALAAGRAVRRRRAAPNGA